MKTTVPTGRLCDTDAEKNAKRQRTSKLRPINKGTYSDVPGKLRKLLREIESGKAGDVTDIVVALRRVQGSDIFIRTLHAGSGSRYVRHYLACRLEHEYYGECE